MRSMFTPSLPSGTFALSGTVPGDLGRRRVNPQVFGRQFVVGAVIETDLEYAGDAVQVQFGRCRGIHTAFLEGLVAGARATCRQMAQARILAAFDAGLAQNCRRLGGARGSADKWRRADDMLCADEHDVSPPVDAQPGHAFRLADPGRDRAFVANGVGSACRAAYPGQCVLAGRALLASRVSGLQRTQTLAMFAVGLAGLLYAWLSGGNRSWTRP